MLSDEYSIAEVSVKLWDIRGLSGGRVSFVEVLAASPPSDLLSKPPSRPTLGPLGSNALESRCTSITTSATFYAQTAAKPQYAAQRCRQTKGKKTKQVVGAYV